MSMSLLQDYLTTQRFFYQKNSRHATNTFGLDNHALYNSYPRFPFEYYIRINLNSVGTAYSYVNSFFTNPVWEQVQPLVKTVELPSIKIDTDSKNQYNRKRISQTKINFEPVKMVFHDVADGKTLKLWEMYYRYYFADGNEPGMNIAREQNFADTMELQRGIGAGVARPSDITQATITTQNIRRSNTNNSGNKRDLQNIVSNTLDNHLFGYNLPKVANIRNLISSIDIFQVHAGRFNQVTLVNPRIATFNHDTLNYAETTKTMEVSFVFEYEYAFYTIHNLKLGGNETNNVSSIEPFINGKQLEIPSITFTATLNDYLESNNPILAPESTAVFNNRNVQGSLDSITNSLSELGDINRVRTSVLDRLVDMGRTVQSGTGIDLGTRLTMDRVMSQAERVIQSRNFNSAAVRRDHTEMYKGLA